MTEPAAVGIVVSMSEQSVCDRVLRQRVVEAMQVSGSCRPDIWAIYRDGALFSCLLDAFAARLSNLGISHVVGVEAKGLVLGAALAVRIGVGFVPMRKGEGGRMAGRLYQYQLDATAGPPGRLLRFAVQAHALSGAQVALVDDWFETGATARAAVSLVAACGGQLVAMAVMVDASSAATRPVHPFLYALRAADQPDDSSEFIDRLAVPDRFRA